MIRQTGLWMPQARTLSPPAFWRTRQILSMSIAPAFSTGIIGAFYSLGGLSLLITRKKWGAAFSITFIGAEILGRIYLVMTGIAPSTGADAVKIVVGGAIALALLVYIGLNRKPAAYTSSLPVLLFLEGCRFKFGMA